MQAPKEQVSLVVQASPSLQEAELNLQSAPQQAVLSSQSSPLAVSTKPSPQIDTRPATGPQAGPQTVHEESP